MQIVEQVKKFAIRKRIIIRPIINDRCFVVTNKKKQIGKTIGEILQNRIENNPPNTMIVISIKSSDDMLNIYIKDNGLQNQQKQTDNLETNQHIAQRKVKMPNQNANRTRISIAVPLFDHDKWK